MVRRATFSRSPLARPESPIHKLAASVGELIYFPNPDPLYAVMGTVAGNCLKGIPVWLILVGPPSDGKTMLLDMLDNIPRVHSIDMIKSLGCLISGSPKKEVKSDATGGILRQLGRRGLLLVKDWTCMMSLNSDAVIEVVGALRRVYDGKFDRPVGSDGARVLKWFGSIGLISGSTSVIDKHHQILSELGERWMYYRSVDDGDNRGYGASKKMSSTPDPKEVMERLRVLVAEFFEDIGLYWSDDGMDRRVLNEEEANRIFAMAALSSAARSPVGRDYRTREVISLKETETPTRLNGALGQMYLGMEFIGLEEEHRWRVLGKTAMDSMPGVRLGMIKLMSKGPAVSAKVIRDELGCSPNTVRFAAEDLSLHGIVEKVERGERMGERAGSYRLTSWAKRQLAVGWKV